MKNGLKHVSPPNVLFNLFDLVTLDDLGLKCAQRKLGWYKVPQTRSILIYLLFSFDFFLFYFFRL